MSVAWVRLKMKINSNSRICSFCSEGLLSAVNQHAGTWPEQGKDENSKVNAIFCQEEMSVWNLSWPCSSTDSCPSSIWQNQYNIVKFKNKIKLKKKKKRIEQEKGYQSRLKFCCKNVRPVVEVPVLWLFSL